MLDCLRWIVGSLLKSLYLSLGINHITHATSIMWSVGCSLFLHLSIFALLCVVFVSLPPSLSVLSGHRELWSEGIVGGKGREINTTTQ